MKALNTIITIYAILGLMGLLTGCASPHNRMEAWIDATQSELIASWGAPSGTVPDGKGGTILIYYSPGQLSPGLRLARMDNTPYMTTSEKKIFYVNENGHIYDWEIK